MRLDLRRTLRAGLRSGELLDLALLRRRRRRLKLALICDVSKSMDLYSRFLIQFMFAFQRAYRRIETFVFSTGLHRITDQLRGPNWPPPSTTWPPRCRSGPAAPASAPRSNST